MKVTIYTINDAESDFCKQAKDFLTAHNIQFENKDVEHDRKALSEMLALSDNFSGVPVIVVEEEGKDKQVLKGFTQQEVEQALGLSVAAEAAVAAPEVQMPAAAQTEPFDSAQGVAVAPEKVEPTTQPLDQTMSAPIASAPIMPDPMPAAPMAPSVEPVMPAPTPIEPAVVEPVSETPTAAPIDMTAPAMDTATVPAADDNHEDQLKGIMDTLAQNGAAPAWTPPAAVEPVVPTVPESPVVETPAMPVMDTPTDAAPTPAAPAGDMPSIPDFPQK